MRKNTMELSLRPRRVSDDGFIYRLSDRVFSAYSAHPGSTMASILHEPGARVMIAEHGRAAVGFFAMGVEHLGRPFGPWQRPAVAYLNAISVQPDLHGRGVGRFLLERAEEAARAAGAVSMSLMTADTNDRAQHLFESAGYHRLLVLQRAYTRGQRGIVMTKAL